MLNIDKWLKVLRVKDWFICFMPLPVIGALLAGGSLYEILLVGIIYFSAISYGFLVNDYFDIEIDKKHSQKVKQRKNSIASGEISKNRAKILLGLLLVTSLSLSVYMSLIGTIFVVFSLIGLLVYSIKWIRLKEKKYIDLLTHGIVSVSFYLGGAFLITSTLTKEIVFESIIFLIWGSIYLISHQLEDYEEDKKASNTTIVHLGLEKGWMLLSASVFLILIITEISIWFYGLSPWLHASSLVTLVYLLKYGNFRKSRSIADRKYILRMPLSFVSEVSIFTLPILFML